VAAAAPEGSFRSVDFLEVLVDIAGERRKASAPVRVLIVQRDCLGCRGGSRASRK
jgi:hypothetical protein